MCEQVNKHFCFGKNPAEKGQYKRNKTPEGERQESNFAT